MLALAAGSAAAAAPVLDGPAASRGKRKAPASASEAKEPASKKAKEAKD